MIGHLLIEGSSTAAGLCDEEGRMGYTGRLFYHYTRYSTEVQANRERRKESPAPPSGPDYVYVRPNVGIDNVTVCYPWSLKHHINEARNMISHYTREQRIVGLFAIGGYLDYWARQEGAQNALDLWQRSLEMLRNVCEEESVRPFLFSVPAYRPGVSAFRHNLPDIELHHDQQAITKDILRDWGAPHATFEDIVGGNQRECLAPDRRHPNAKGYEQISRYFVPLIDREFSITTPDMPPML